MLATYFRGIAPVAMAFDHGIASCVADIALLEAGIPALPLPGFFTADQKSHALRQSGATAILSAVDVTLLDSPDVVLHPGTAKISFTSGSTGTPKGICLSAAHMLGVAQAVVNTLGDAHAGRHLALLPPAILLENVAGFYATLLAGGTYVALPQAQVGLTDLFSPDFGLMARVIAAQAITSLILVPDYLLGLVAVMEASGLRLPLLTLVAVGGARIAPALLGRAAVVGLPVRQGYGLTECASVVTLERPGETIRGSVGGSIGYNALRLAPDGEILIDGPTCLGRIGEPTMTGPLHTGDIGRIDADDRLWIEGRKSNLIITAHGRNIAPEWVESQLLAQPAIAQAMVHGEGAAALGALIVPRSATADIAGAVAAANALLPVYARVAAWRVVAPFTPLNGHLTGNGRLRRAAIAQAHLQEPLQMPFYDRLTTETASERAALIAVPQLQAGLSGRIGLSTYIAYLAQAYHHVRHTVPLMQEARARLAHKPMLVAALDDYIAEETGHEAWILRDIAAAGGDADAVVAAGPNAATAAMVDHAYRVIRTGNPVAFFGMVYVLEGTSVAMASHGADAVRTTLGLPQDAFTYLTSHGALDLAHLQFFETLMNRIDDPADQLAIIAMARAMFGLFGGLFASIPMETLDAAA
jgi:pyrroloquinoline quinone (PQQ) biosynthesis protein C